MKYSTQEPTPRFLEALTRVALAVAKAGFIALPLLSGCGANGPSSDDPAHSREVGPAAAATLEPFPVLLAIVDNSSHQAPSSASGSLYALRRATPGTKLMGRVESVPVDEGQPISKGQLLARIESRDLQAGINKAEAALSMARAQLQNASEQHDRMKVLHERGSVTDKNVEDARAQFRVATAQVENAQASLDEARVWLDYAEIRSPLEGWLTGKSLSVGDMASPGAPAFVVEDLRTLEVSVEISESQLAEVEVGQRITVEVAGTERDATVLRIVPSGNPTSRTFTLEGELDNAAGNLRSGMFARVSWLPPANPATLEFGGGPVRIEATAVRRKGQLEGVFVALPGEQALELRWVTTGTTRDGLVTILSGLRGGEQYVTTPSAELFDGAMYRDGDSQ